MEERIIDNKLSVRTDTGHWRNRSKEDLTAEIVNLRTIVGNYQNNFMSKQKKVMELIGG